MRFRISLPRTKGDAAEDGRGATPSGHAENIRMTVAYMRRAILIIQVMSAAVKYSNAEQHSSGIMRII